MEIVQRNSTLEDLGIEVCGVCRVRAQIAMLPRWTSKTRVPSAKFTEDDIEDEEDELDEWESGLYLCSLARMVSFQWSRLRTKRDAMVQLDEWAGAHVSWLVPLADVHGRLPPRSSGTIELGPFGEEEAGELYSRPLLSRNQRRFCQVTTFFQKMEEITPRERKQR